jgi:hypothetical protein
MKIPLSQFKKKLLYVFYGTIKLSLSKDELYPRPLRQRLKKKAGGCEKGAQGKMCDKN